MVFRVHMIDPRDHSDQGPICEGNSNRPASWPSREAAEAIAADWTKYKTWNHLRDTWSYEFQVVDTREESSSISSTPQKGST